ncbi:MAG TPA: efflux RND transporter periplasmic adaptor subunit [Hyphomonadaceae bacterium]|nr:efflux RND transporter periplasmic adaptor subunit [Hyphomonadaceae bacterium]
MTIILGAIALVAAVIGIRALMTSGDTIATVKAETIPTLDKPMAGNQPAHDGMQVVVRRSVAEVRPLYLSLSGRTEAARDVTVKAETTGTITSAPAQEGKVVDKGALLCGLDIEGRGAKLREAEAETAQKQNQYNAAVELAAKGWAAEARVTAAKAALDAAQAGLDVAKSEMAKTQIRAPFRGVFEKRMASTGDFLSPGGACGTVVELDPVVVIADVPEKNAAQVHVDAPSKLKLSDGGEALGHVRYLAKTADAATRMFRVEVEIANPNNLIPVGRVAEVRIQIGQGDAHKINPALLTLDEQGRIGVRYLDVGGIVSFAPADVVDETADGTWIAGLPREALIVAEGQDNVKPGLRATPVVRDDPPPAPPPLPTPSPVAPAPGKATAPPPAKSPAKAQPAPTTPARTPG